ncbi:MAG: hypothetical protein H6840_08125 [Planctomycetes bacterium]|nr:hypothetical protein [Planctomycetota bacterium]
MDTEPDRIHTRQRDELLKTGRAWLAPAGLFFAFQKYLETLPWGAHALDTRRLPEALRVDSHRLSEQELADWLNAARIANSPRVGVYWSAFEPVLLIETEWALKRLNWLADFHPQGLFLFGLELEQGKWTPHFEDWLHYDGRSSYTATR